MSELFRQRIAVNIGDTLAYQSWHNTDNPAMAGFNMSFTISRSAKGDPNKGSVVITNPPENEAFALLSARKPPLVRVLFGWETTGLTLVGGGQVEKDGAKLTYNGPDSQLSLSFVDGLAALRGSYVAVKLPAGTMASEAVRAVAEAAGLPLGVVDIAPEDDYPLPRSYTADGSARDVLERLGRALGADASIQDGRLQMLARKRTAGGTGPLFSSKNGTLLARPEPRGRDGAIFQVVLTPGLQPGGRFEVESPTFFGSGVWKATDVRASAGSYTAATMQIEARRSK